MLLRRASRSFQHPVIHSTLSAMFASAFVVWWLSPPGWVSFGAPPPPRNFANLHPRQLQADCISPLPVDTFTDRVNTLLNNPTAAGLSIKLCPDTEYVTTGPLKFGNINQEITTLGFPGLDLARRATIKVDGAIGATAPQNHTVAVDGTCEKCDGSALRYIQIDGNRNGAPIVPGGANIEMGGWNQHQVIEYVHTFDPRAWSCMHIAEGPMECSNTTIQYNDIGPCGTDAFNQWADGISLSCRDSTVRHNTITGATDGGIVIFGSPGSKVYNNTIICGNDILLGGINLVDYDPWNGSYVGTVVENNVIMGGFATDKQEGPTDLYGLNDEKALIKIGIAMGPRTWFGDKYGMNETRGAVVRNNVFSGAFGFAMAAATVNNFTITGNKILNDTTFIGSAGPNCSTTDVTPAPYPFIFNSSQVLNSSVQQEFAERDADFLICIMPDGDDWWPYKPSAHPELSSTSPNSTTPTGTHDTSKVSSGAQGGSQGSRKGSIIGLGVGIATGVLAAMAMAVVIRHCYMKRNRRAKSLS